MSDVSETGMKRIDWDGLAVASPFYLMAILYPGAIFAGLVGRYGYPMWYGLVGTAALLVVIEVIHHARR